MYNHNIPLRNHTVFSKKTYLLIHTDKNLYSYEPGY